MLWSADTCQYKVSADFMGSGLELIEVTCFLEVDHCPGTDFRLDDRLKPG